MHDRDASGLQTLASLLPEGIGAGPALLLVAASFFTSALTAAFGVGGGIAMLALMGLFVPVAALIPVHGTVQLGSNTGRAWHQRNNVRLDIAVPFVAGSVVGAIFGVFLVVQLPDALLKLVLGVFIIAVIVGEDPRHRPSRPGRPGSRKRRAGAAFHVRRRDRTADVGDPGADPLQRPQGAGGDPRRGDDGAARLKIIVFGLAGFAFLDLAAADRGDDRVRLPRYDLRHEAARPHAGRKLPALVQDRR